MPRPLILASASPRRLELLRQIGLDPKVEVPEVDEELSPGIDIADAVVLLAIKKAAAVAERHLGNDIVIVAADTLVVVDGEPLVKPSTSAEAVAMLSRLAGRRHQVMTGVALIETGSGQQLDGLASTAVHLRRIELQEIETYVATGEPFDKAGGYAIQGRAAVFVERIDGDYSNVVGIPLSLVDQLLREL